jgi:pterin-4a-carbinolamine dehydratase
MAEENKTPLSAAQVDEALQTLAGWTRSEAVLARHFVFHDFEEITAFLTPWCAPSPRRTTTPISAAIPG